MDARQKISKILRVNASRGQTHHSYKDGKVVERRGERASLEYKRWHTDVFMNDGFKCVKCGDAKGGNLAAHHKKSYAGHPELRFDVANGETLCDECHHAAHGTGMGLDF